MSDYLILEQRAESLLQNQDAVLSAVDKEQAFREALARYNRDAPHTIVENFTGDGALYQFTFVGAFLPGFSQIDSVELPTGSRPQTFLEAADYRIYRSATSTVVLDLPHHTPDSGDTMRVTYTVRHTIQDLDLAAATTIPVWHEEAVTTLAASRMLARLASRFIHEQDSTIDADAINRNSKDESAAKRSRAFESDYKDLMGIRKGVPPGLVVLDFDSSFSGSGMEYLTHGSRWR